MVWYGMVCYAIGFSTFHGFGSLSVCLAGQLSALAGGLSALAGWLATWLAGCLFVSSRRFQQPTKSNDLQTVPMA